MARFIDDKGRLFEKINIIDLLVILFFIAFTPMLYFGHKLYNRPISFIESITPNEVQKGDKQNIIIKGKFLHDVVDVKFGDKKLIKDIKVKNSELIEVAIPDDLLEGTYDIIVMIPIYENTNAAYYKDGLKVKLPPPIPFAVELYIFFNEVDDDLLNSILAGDIEKDKSGKEIGKIVELLKTEPDIKKVNIGGIINLPIADKKRVLAKVKLSGEIKDKSFFYKGSVLTIGSVFNFTTDEYDIKGEVFSLPYTDYIVKIKVENLKDEKAKLINQNDSHIDINGNVIGIVRSEPNITPSKQIGFIESERLFKMMEYPSYKDVILDLEVKLIERDSAYFYNENQRIYVGNPITFNTDKYSINGTVISMRKIK